jgi:hypothetical protein
MLKSFNKDVLSVVENNATFPKVNTLKLFKVALPPLPTTRSATLHILKQNIARNK